MKALRTIGVLVLVLGLVVGSIGSVLAKGPPVGKKHGFNGNVTAVGDGNITIATKQGWTVVLMRTGTTKYNIPRETKGWIDDYDGNITALIGRRVAALAGNVTETPLGPFAGNALRVLVLPGAPLHAHRSGIVTAFDGNITIKDVKGISHTFQVVKSIVYHPQGIGSGNITAVPPVFVTVVTKGDPKLGPLAKAIVLHGELPAWARPTPTPTASP